MGAAKKRAKKKAATRKPHSPVRPRARKKKTGRPAIVWGSQAEEDLRRLALVGCTVQEIAAILDVSKSSLDTACHGGDAGMSKAYAQAVAGRHRGLRTVQYRKAMLGHPTMLIWLGKQDLGQRDTKQIPGELHEPDSIEADLTEIKPTLRRKLSELIRSRRKSSTSITKPAAAS